MIIKNCPACEDIPEFEITNEGCVYITRIDTPNYCTKYKKVCCDVDIDDCIMKQIYKECKEIVDGGFVTSPYGGAKLPKYQSYELANRLFKKFEVE